MNEILIFIAKELEEKYRHKYVDEDFLREIFNRVVELQGTYEYVCNGFEYGGKAPFFLAAGGYNKIEKKIQFFDMIIGLTRNEVHNDMNIKTDDRAIFATNILMVNTLLHELEHVNQEKKKATEENFETYLLNSEEGNTETTETYDYIPSERFAENIALQQTKTILDNMSVIEPDIYDYLEQRRNYWIIKGYVDEANQCMVYPIKRYMNKHGKVFGEMSLDEAIATYPELEDRLFLGLPISDEEYHLVRKRAGLANTRNSYSLW